MMNPIYKIPDLWLGDLGSLQRVANAVAYLRANPGLDHKVVLGGYYDDDEDSDEEEDSLTRMMRNLADSISFRVGTVGVVEVDGTLVQETGYINSWFGLVSYDTIVYAANQFAEAPDITSIVIAWATSGGSALGVDDAGASLRAIGKEKPLYSYVKSEASSAGYWLAAEAQKIYGPRMSEVGSIGAVVEYTSIARMLEETGIDTKIIRSGPEKALGHPVEPINAKATAMLQKKVDTFDGFFVQHVEARRPVSLDNKDDWAGGKVFFMEEAVSLGLADGVISMEALLGRLDQSNAEADPGAQYKSFSQSILLRGGSMAKELKITEEQQAALASGAAPESLGIIVPPVEGSVDGTPPVEGSGEGTPPVEGSGEGTPPVEGSGEGTPPVEGSGEGTPPTEVPEMVAFLKEELRTTQTSLAATNAKLADKEAASEATAISLNTLMPIAVEAIGRLQVALGQSPAPLDSLTPAALGTLYAETKKTFETRFPVGQQSIDDGAAEEMTTEQRAAQLGLYAVGESA